MNTEDREKDEASLENQLRYSELGGELGLQQNFGDGEIQVQAVSDEGMGQVAKCLLTKNAWSTP